jgi:uncharacterized delta-60 repeat protein
MKIAAIPLLLLSLTTAARGQSALDGFDPNANDKIRVVVVQPDGKILIGGDFTTLAPNGGAVVTRNRIARLNPDGTLDTAFDPNANRTDYAIVYAIALQPDGKILVGGLFTSIGGQQRNNIARLDATTGLADSCNPNANDLVLSIALQADGKILAGGAFSSIGGQARIGIARLDATTGLADSFDPNAPNGAVEAIVVQADGKILVGGVFGTIGGQQRNNIARLDATTGLADSFNPSASDLVLSIALQADGKILAGGFFTTIGGQPRNRIARLDATTGLADSFDPNANLYVYAIVVQADGKILVGGNFNVGLGQNSIGGQPRNYIARLDPVTGLADSFDPNANSFVLSIAVQPDGKILTGGDFNGLLPNGGAFVTRNRIARLETDGRLDQTLVPNLGTPFSGVTVIAVQPDGKILICGEFATVSGVARNRMARLNTDGTLDMAFDPNASGTVLSIAVQADGKILAGGYFTSIGGQPRNRIARLDAATGAADSFDPNADEFVSSIAVQADGKILVGGRFAGANSIGGQPRNFIARLDPITGLADSFNPNANGTVASIVVQADGKILVGGTFNDTFQPITIGGQRRNNIARLEAATGLADSFDPNASYSVFSIALQADGKILAGGDFISIGGQPRNHMARLDATTGLADSFDPNPSEPNKPGISSIAVQADGKILVAGRFDAIGGQTRHGVARLDATTGLADSFDANASGPDGFTSSSAIAVQIDGKILLGGYFTNIGGQPRDGFARLSNDTAALQNLSGTKTAITWTRGGSSPQFTRVTFESSNDNVNYTPIGNGTAAGSNWTLTGLTLPIAQTIYIRARGYYRSGPNNGSECIAESVRNAFIPRPSTLANISTRLRVLAGDNAMIGGFIITGTEPKTVIVRGIAPSLSLPGALADPVIEVHGSAGALLATNDNWRDDPNQQHVIDSGVAPTNDLESALWGIINPGAYTVVVRGKNGATGIALFEVYDVDQTVDSKLANVSTRGFVGTGDNIMVGGAIIIGSLPARVLFRAIGPSLTNFGVPNALADPVLELYDGNGGLIAINYDWRDDQEAEIIATGIPPSNNLESAIVRDLIPGNYTAIVHGLNGTTGIAVVEAYGLN